MCLHAAYDVGGVIHSRDLALTSPSSRPPASNEPASTELMGAEDG